METTIRFDFTRSATRKNVFAELVSMLDAAQRRRIAAVVDDTALPLEGRCHDLAAVEKAIALPCASNQAKADARAVYGILAAAEAQVHGCALEETHFHEVGENITVRDIVAIAEAFVLLAPARVVATPVQVGSGSIECEHGTLDVPAPATAAIIERFSIPVQATRLPGELCTPTSAALIAHYVQEFE